MVLQWMAGLLLLLFYGIYIVKLLLQKRRGIQTDQIARGKPKDKVYYIEFTMKIATYSTVIVEVVSILGNSGSLPWGVRGVGMALTMLGVIVFGLAVWTMGDSWRAGIAKKDNTEMVTAGIYRFSRNPAFLGFDLVYIGILILFFNWILCVVSLFAMGMLHLQILQEEKFLPTVFGEEYLSYLKKVRRYF